MYSFINLVGFVSDRYGRSNSAIYFNNGYASIPTSGLTQTFFQSTAVWAYYIGAGCTDILTIESLWFWCSCGSVLHFHTSNSFDSTYFPPLNTWVHLGTVISNGYMTLYVNGAVERTYVFSDLYYGGAVYLAGPDRPFIGYIDDLMIFKTSLSSSQMNAVKNYYY